MSIEPEKIFEVMGKMNKALGHMNSMLVKSISRMERASTKIVAAHSSTHGIMMGVVADLDLMTGAFGKIKHTLANLFLPVDSGSKKIWKLWSAMTSLEGMWTHILKPIKGNMKAMREQTKIDKLQAKAIKENIAIDQDATDQAKEKYSAQKLQSALEGKWVESEPGSGMMVAATPAAPFTLPGGPPGFEKPPDPEGPTRMEKLHNTMGKTWKTMKKPVKSFEKNVAGPLRQIASGGLGLGFQATIVMGLMQAFASLFTIFTPIMDVVGALMERLSVGFMPLIEMVMEILTSEPVLNMIDLLAAALAEIFEMFRPLVPIIIDIISLALKPLSMILEGIMPVIQIIAELIGTLLIAFMPLIEIIMDILGPALTVLTKIFLLLVVLGLYPLMYAIYGIGMFVAALITLFSFGTVNAIAAWNNLMMPILGALNVATGAVIESFQTGTDYVPQTGPYLLHKSEVVLNPQESAAYRGGAYGNSVINLHVDGGVWVQNIDDLADVLGRKLNVRRY